MSILLFGSSHCAPCGVVKHKLDSHWIEYDYIDVESKSGMGAVQKYGVSSVPTMILTEGDDVTFITGNAINEELARILR